MISRISGTVWDIGDEYVVVRTGGVGFQVFVGQDVLDDLGTPGQPIELYTHMQVRENDITLYGFPTKEKLSLFHLLLGVSGVGPKVGLSMLSTLSPHVLQQAVLQDEPGILTRVPGVGKKTAAAIIFYLKDRLEAIAPGKAVPVDETAEEVIETLTSLGFSLVEAQRALQSVSRDDSLSFEERVRQALAFLDGR